MLKNGMNRNMHWNRIKTLTLFVAFASIIACKEIPPFIDYSVPIQLSRDTTYLTTSTLPTQARNVLIEDISGDKCVNCPTAAAIAHSIKENNDEGRVVIMTLHTWKLSNLTAPLGKDTLNTDDATNIIQTLIIGDIQGLPNGSVNRKIYDGKTEALLNPTSWESYANQDLNTQSDIYAELELIPDKANRSVIANVKIISLKEINEPLNMTLALTESHIIGPQETKPGSQVVIVEDYEHNFILRKTITNYGGINLAQSFERGRTFEKGFEFTLPAKSNFDNCTVVLLIHKTGATDKQVLQVVEANL
ncbi:MAG: Omp28-related outer membrane protein [Bacteroidetes bacterium]|nr:Omp28-related outer membrane protein [Bacteroidota bacterium]